MSGISYFSCGRVEDAELREHSLVAEELDVNFPQERQKFFLGDEQRLANFIIDTVLREGVAGRETVA